MLDALRLRDETGVEDLLLRILLEKLLRLFDEPLHADALLAARAGAKHLEHLLQPLDVAFGLLEMVGECLLQLRVGRCFDHFRQRFDELLLGAVQVLQLLDVQVLQ